MLTNLSLIAINLAILCVPNRDSRKVLRPPTSSTVSLLNAVFNDDLIATRRALDNGANVEARDANQATPLITAAEHNNVAWSSLLLEKGANPANENKQNETALTVAARSGNFEIANVLVAVGVTPTEMKRALFEAVRGGGVVIVDMTDAGKESTGHPEKPLDESQYSPWIKTVRLLLDKGAPA